MWQFITIKWGTWYIHTLYETKERTKKRKKKHLTRENFIYLKTVWLANESLESSQANEQNEQTATNEQAGRQAGRLADGRTNGCAMNKLQM